MTSLRLMKVRWLEDKEIRFLSCCQTWLLAVVQCEGRGREGQSIRSKTRQFVERPQPVDLGMLGAPRFAPCEAVRLRAVERQTERVWVG